MDKWEYRIFNVGVEDIYFQNSYELFKEKINHLGSDGWEVISIAPIAPGEGGTNYLCVFLKRKLD